MGPVSFTAAIPVSDFAQIARFSALRCASVPDRLGRLFEGAEGEPELRRMIGMVVAAEQVRLLQANGVDEFSLLYAEPA